MPPIALLAAVHGIALAVRAGASGRIYWWAVTASGLIGLGAFAVSFLALRDLMLAIGEDPAAVRPAVKSAADKPDDQQVCCIANAASRNNQQ